MSILVCDDTVESRLVLQAMLRAGGYSDVTLAESAREAFSYLNFYEPASTPPAVDLILMDLLMPNMDGIEACRLLKATEHLRGIPIIVVTSKAETKDLQTAFDAGAMDYLVKPVKRVELLARVRSALLLKHEMDCRKARELELTKGNHALQLALQEIKVLQGFIPICANCKNIRNAQGYWEEMMVYIREHSHVEFTHGICDRCMKVLYPDLDTPETDHPPGMPSPF